MDASLTDAILAVLAAVGHRLLAALPAVLTLLAVLAVGLVAGWLASRIVTRLARALDLDRRATGWGLASSFGREPGSRTPTEMVGLAVFWGLLLLIVVLAVDAMAVPGTERVTAFLFGWIPTALGAVVILVVGSLLANFLAQGTLIAAVNAGVPEARLLARVVRWGLLLFTLAAAATHLGLAKEMVLVAFGLSFGGLVLAAAIAFGLGGRHLAREILERRLRREREPERPEPLTHL
jgi:hypothetical protein